MPVLTPLGLLQLQLMNGLKKGAFSSLALVVLGILTALIAPLMFAITGCLSNKIFDKTKATQMVAFVFYNQLQWLALN